MSKTKANFLCLIVACIWGGGFIGTASALASFQPLTIVFIRFLFASILAFIYMKLKKEKLTRNDFLYGCIPGIFLCLAFSFQTIGLQYTSTGNNAFLTSVNVILVPYICFILYKRKPDLWIVLSSFLSFIGIGCLSLQNGLTISKGDAYSLLCALFFAFHIVSLEWAVQKGSVDGINTIQMFTSAILVIPFMICFETWPAAISTNSILGCIYIIFISTFLAYQLQTVAQKYTDASSACVLLGCECLFANLFGMILFHERKTPIMWLGGLLIFISILICNGKALFQKKEML
ncbi:MAG: DMT family transporter [Holdemanella sp.]|nr:DMT family transporter [Holdemanella sp.]